jgi:tetratricopeptide (TPR) repeat protein
LSGLGGLPFYYDGYYDNSLLSYRDFMLRLASVDKVGESVELNAIRQIISTAATGIFVSSSITSSIEKMTEEASAARRESADRLDAMHGTLFAGFGEMDRGLGKGFSDLSRKASEINQTLSDGIEGLANGISGGFSRLDSQGRKINEKLDYGFRDMRRGLDFGFANLQRQLGQISSGFNLATERLNRSVQHMSLDVCGRLEAIGDALNSPYEVKKKELFNRAVIRYRKGFYEESVEDLRRAIRIDKTDCRLWYLLGINCLLGAGESSCAIDLDMAMEAFAKAGKYLQPDIGEDEALGKLAAEMSFCLGLSMQMKARESINKGETEEAEGLLEDAEQAYWRSWSRSDGMLESLYNAARCAVLRGNPERASAYLRIIILKDKMYVLKSLGDPDFADYRDGFEALIKSMREELSPSVREGLELIRHRASRLKERCGWLPAELKREMGEVLPESYLSDPALYVGRLPYFDMRCIIERCATLASELKEDEALFERIEAEEVQGEPSGEKGSAQA